ncbi:class I SAM-dependent methyltransferase [Flavivirga rizhaonensis]|uniref:Class I SAM-dependent methyltransferase n=1 Tax=Flavivirga rizhaonensis TaxID=2559571 RepID=A0A4S1DWY7_9FLAO|nr:class I SAM-dependent methyltransferase [Flavivirga rizhaonensis]TGV02569.1 class I SAM-dependent methyltransferase [Flavivirga rizhaonensis]
MKKSFEKQYHLFEKNHFWFKARRKYILQLLNTYSKNSSILDIGCSSGILLNELINIGFDSSNLFGIDISPKAIKNCKKNGIENAYVMDAQNILLNKKFDIIIASDCLEHIKNDEEAIKNWFNLLKPNGFLYVFVPAYNMLWSNHDVANMHYRRYTKNELTKKLYGAPFKVVKSGYWNFLLFIPVLIIRIFSKIKILKSKEVNGNLYKPGLLNNILFNLINLENKVLKHISFPFGISTYCVVQKSASKKD